MTPAEKRLALRCRKYGITPVQYHRMAMGQGKLCAICKRPPKVKPLEIDHCHKTGRVRGLLCFRCNHRLLGRGLEDVTLHMRAAQYLASDFDARAL